MPVRATVVPSRPDRMDLSQVRHRGIALYDPVPKLCADLPHIHDGRGEHGVIMDKTVDLLERANSAAIRSYLGAVQGGLPPEAAMALAQMSFRTVIELDLETSRLLLGMQPIQAA